MTFVTKGEIESKFLGTHTEEAKLNPSVNTTLNQLVIQFELVYLKSYFKIHPFILTLENHYLNLLFLIKHYLEVLKEGIVRN